MFNDTELGALKTVFADNEELLYAIRNVLLQLPLSEAQAEMLKAQVSEETYGLVKRRIFPEIEPDAPFFQLADMYQAMTNDLNSKGPEEMEANFEVKIIVVDYLAQQFQALKDFIGGVLTDSVAQIKLDDLAVLKGKDGLQRYIDTKARNYIFSHVDTFLNHIKVLAGLKTETVELTKKKLERDSNK